MGQCPSVQVGETYAVTLQCGPLYAQHFGLYIDFNQDGDFLDAGEFFDLGQGQAGTPLVTNLTIPATAPIGTRVLRLRSSFDAPLTATDGCTTSLQFGEIEDYNIYLYCPNNLVINAEPILNGPHDAQVEISSAGKIADGGNVQFRAGTAVLLEPEFEVVLGGVLQVIMQGCFP